MDARANFGESGGHKMQWAGVTVLPSAGGQASAPGQLPVKQLEEILHILHQSVD